MSQALIADSTAYDSPMRRDLLTGEVPLRQVTDPEVFFGRRRFVQAAAAVGVLGPAALSRAQPQADPVLTPPLQRPDVFPAKRAAEPALPEDLDTAITPRRLAATHNNFYEFLPDRAGPVWRLAGDFTVEPWQVEVTGECAKPAVFDLDALFGLPHEERLYHFRCVERWAMNVPWTGFPLRVLLERVQPTSHARFVRFVSAGRPEQMPGLRRAAGYPWPYHEGLRIDEAMHDLAMVVTGVYGAPLLKQHGAPVRIVVPWKYGYKSPKSVVRIELLRAQPRTFWQIYPHEYGFLSNVNPYIPHPRWVQSRSHWIGRPGATFATPIFNGYGRQVAHLYPDEPTRPQRPLRRGQIAR
jgi:sulfoxide reductase catalytic subunit YedY